MNNLPSLILKLLFHGFGEEIGLGAEEFLLGLGAALVLFGFGWLSLRRTLS